MTLKQDVMDGLEKMCEPDMIEHIGKWNGEKKAMVVHSRVYREGWPIERTCAAYQISSTWYRKMLYRHERKWKYILDGRLRGNLFDKKLCSLLGLDYDKDLDKAMDILYSSPISEKITDDEEHGLVFYDAITDEDLEGLKDYIK